MPLIDKQRLMGSGQVTSASVNNEGTFHPKQISGLNQWYDASDASTLTTASIVVGTTSSILSSPLDIPSCSLWLDANDSGSLTTNSWSPLNIPSCSLWLDASDTSTITEEEWSPLNIPSCSLWLDADDASTLTVSGSRVSQWDDKSGNGNHYGQATESNQPYLSSSVALLNNRDVVFLRGEDGSGIYQFLTRSVTTDYSDPSTHHFTTFIAYRVLSGGNDYKVLFSFGKTGPTSFGTQYVQYDIRSTNAIHPNFFGSSYDVYVTRPHSDWEDKNLITTGRSYSSGTELRLTGALQLLDTSGNPTINGDGFSNIGAPFLGSQEYSHTYMAEIIQYKRGLTDAECAAVETYLQNKWGITVATQSSDVYEGNAITNWSSKVGSVSATQTGSAYRPTTGNINGKNVILFSGSSDSTAPYLEITGSGTASFNFVPTIDSYTIFAAFQQNEGTPVDVNYALFSGSVYTSGGASASQIDNLEPILYGGHWYSGSADLAIDGDTSQGFFAGSMTHTSASAGAWWQVDFDQSREIHKTVVYGRKDVQQDRLQQYRLDFYSGSYASGSQIHSLISTYSGSGVDIDTQILTSSVVCKAIRLTKIQDNAEPLSIAEFQAFGSSSQSAIVSKGRQYAITYDKGFSGLSSDTGFIESTTAGNNTQGTTFHLVTNVVSPTLNKIYVTGTLARTGSNVVSITSIIVTGTVNFALSANGSTASQIDTGWGGVPERAIDGNTHGNYSNNSVTHTDTDAGAWWQVDFGQSRRIAKTVVYGRTDVQQDRLQQYRLDFYSGSYASGDEIHTVTSPYLEDGVGNATPDTLIFPPVDCQTIRLTKIHDNAEPLSIAEFQAFGGDYAEPFKIGAYELPNSGSINRILSGAIGELLVYSGSLSDADRTAVETYLQNKWNITVATQSADVVPTVSEWRNKSTEFAGYFDLKQSNASNQPTYVTGVVNNKPVVRCDGTSSFMYSSGSNTYRTPAASNDELTIFYVFKYFPTLPTSGYGQDILYWGMDSNYEIQLSPSFVHAVPAGDRNNQGGADRGVQFFAGGSNARLNKGFTTTPLVYSARNQSSSSPVRITGSGEHTYETLDILPFDDFYSPSNRFYQRFGVAADNLTLTGRYLYGDVAEIICYARNLSDDEMAKVETYLDNKWNITVATQSYVSTNVTSSVLTQWQDKSGNALHLTASSTASAPVLSANEIYSYSAVQFSGTVSSSNPVLTSSTEVYGVPWYPTSIPSCSLWLDADDASSMTVSGTSISEWRNKSTDDTGLFDGVQSNASYQPTTVASEINGRSVVRFDGSDDHLNFSGSTSRRAPSSTGGEITSFIVMKKNGTPTHREVMMQYGLTAEYHEVTPSRIWLWYDRKMASPYYASMVVFADTGWGITYDANSSTASMFSFARDNSSHQIYHTGSQVTAVSDVETTLNNGVFYPTSGQYRYGRYGGRGLDLFEMPFHGDIAELICYSRKLSTAERSTVETYLQNKWGITVATQSSDVSSNNYDPAYPTQSVSTEAKSIVSIIKQDNANSGSVWAFVSGSEYDGTLTTNEGGNTDFAYGGTTETSSFTSPFSNSTSSVVTAIWGGEYSKLYKDGTLLTSSQNNTTLSSSAYLALGTSFVADKTPWYPTSIPSCSLWLDANDASTIIREPAFTNWADASNGTTAQASSTTGHIPSNAIDGDTTGGFFHSSQGTNEWLQIDFGQNRNIDKVVIWHRSATYSQRMDGYRLDFYTGSYGSGSVVHTISESPGSSWTSNTSILTASINCRSIRLVNEDATQPQYTEVQEFQAFENTGYTSSISQWNDKSGNGNHYGQTTANAQPAYSASAINGKYAVATDAGLGTQQYLTRSSTTDYVDSNNQFTTFVVIQWWKDHYRVSNGATDVCNLFTFGNNPAGVYGFGTQYSHWQVHTGYLISNFYGNNPADVNYTIPGGSTAFQGVNHVLTNRSYSSGTEIRITGSLALLETNGNPTIDADGWSGFPNGKDNEAIYGSWYYGEIIHYNRGLTDAECAKVETYLQNKWGITVATQSSDIDTDNTLTGSISTYWSGSIGEMLVYNKAISDKERRRAENYLQQKWRTSGSSGTGNGNGGGGGGYP